MKKKIGKPDKILKIVTGNKSEKLKSKIRQLLYSLQIKIFTKQLYKSLIDIILKWKQSL